MSESFVLKRDIPAEWVRELEQYAPPQDRFAHLTLWWEPGSPAKPIQRWLVCECTPEQFVQDKVRALLARPPCQCSYQPEGHLTLCLGCQRPRSVFRQFALQYLREKGCLPEAFWIIQGDKGGHKLDFLPHEQEISQWLYGRTEPPEPGSLPYAPFDQRVIRALRAQDWLNQKWVSYYVARQQNADQALRDLRKTILKTVEERLAQAVDEAMPALLGADLPKLEEIPDYERVYDEYIATGDMEAPAGLIRPGPVAILTPE